jgi:hypothetical protein
MTKPELQVALAAATKRTAGVFLDTLSTLAHKAVKKKRRIRLAWIWQARKAEKEGSHGLQSEDAAENQNSSQDRRQIPSRQGGKGRGSGAKEVDLLASRIYIEKRLTTRPGRDHNSAAVSS